MTVSLQSVIKKIQEKRTQLCPLSNWPCNKCKEYKIRCSSALTYDINTEYKTLARTLCTAKVLAQKFDTCTKKSISTCTTECTLSCSSKCAIVLAHVIAQARVACTRERQHVRASFHAFDTESMILLCAESAFSTGGRCPRTRMALSSKEQILHFLFIFEERMEERKRGESITNHLICTT